MQKPPYITYNYDTAQQRQEADLQQPLQSTVHEVHHTVPQSLDADAVNTILYSAVTGIHCTVQQRQAADAAELLNLLHSTYLSADSSFEIAFSQAEPGAFVRVISQSKYSKINNFVRKAGLKNFALVPKQRTLSFIFIPKCEKLGFDQIFLIVPEKLTSPSGNNGFFVPAERPY